MTSKKLFCLTAAALSLSFAQGRPASADVESVPEGEASAITETSGMIEKLVRAQAAQDGIAHRDAHAKQHGCVTARFEVQSGLPPELAVGVFSEARTFPAWIRFSNGSGRSQNDLEGDGRGMAIKLMGVEGEKILAEEKNATTQDFVMINHPTFFVRNAIDYLEFQKTILFNGSPLKFFLPGLNPLKWRAHELSVANAIRSKKVSSPLRTPYWSMTPYALGDGQMKYSVTPCTPGADIALPRVGPDFLRTNMQKELAVSSACFDFLVQRRTDPASMPIEDPSIEWSAKRAPFVRVARVLIPRQDFASAAKDEFCENLSFTPWHSVPELRPLGGINRVRRVVYEQISKLRHELNRVTRAEPRE